MHCGLKVSRSQTKIYENFANYFFKTKANNKCFIVLKCKCKGLQKSKSELERLLKIYETFYEQAESMCIYFNYLIINQITCTDKQFVRQVINFFIFYATKSRRIYPGHKITWL